MDGMLARYEAGGKDRTPKSDYCFRPTLKKKHKSNGKYVLADRLGRTLPSMAKDPGYDVIYSIPFAGYLVGEKAGRLHLLDEQGNVARSMRGGDGFLAIEFYPDEIIVETVDGLSQIHD